MEAILMSVSIDLQGRMVNMKLVAHISGNNAQLECWSSVDEVILKQQENPGLSLFDTLTSIASEKLWVSVSIPWDLSEFLIQV